MRTLHDHEAEHRTADVSSARRTRSVLFLVAALVAVALAAGALVATRNGSNPSGSDEPTPTVTAAPVPTSTPTVATVPVSSPGMVLASSQGVTVTSTSGNPVRISTDRAAIAYGIGSQYVAFQRFVGSDSFPPQREDRVKVWADGNVRDLPLGPRAAYVSLLDARTVDGEAYALVSEHTRAPSPAEAFEELVRIRLRDGARTVLIRRPSWESGHGAAQLLPGGHLLGLLRVTAGAHAVRWAPGATEATWNATAGHDGNFDFALAADAVTIVDQRTTRPVGTPQLVLTAFNPVTGAPGATRTVTVRDPARTIGTGLSCTGWFTATELLCGHAGDRAGVELYEGPGHVGAAVVPTFSSRSWEASRWVPERTKVSLPVLATSWGSTTVGHTRDGSASHALSRRTSRAVPLPLGTRA